MNILVLSDLHIPNRLKFERLLEIDFNKYDYIIVSGDIVEEDTYMYLNSLSQILYAVYGNSDDYYIKQSLSEKKIVQIQDKKIGIIHGQQEKRDDKKALLKRFDNIDIMIYGHSHNQSLENINNTIVLNPGAFCQGKYAEIEIIKDKINIKLKGDN